MKTVKSFKDYDFDSWDVPEKYNGDYAPQNYFKGEFVPALRKEFKAIAKNLNAELKFSANHFECSAFFSVNGKYIYVHIGDVRFNNWFESVLYRTAKDDKDYSGGANCYCGYEELENELTDLFERM